jgi:hypothetical protein
MAGPDIAPLHVLAWKDALDAEGIELSVWRIHRKISMSGGLFTNQLLRETAYQKQTNHIRPVARSLRIADLVVGGRHSVGDRQAAAWKLQPSIRPLSASIRIGVRS